MTGEGLAQVRLVAEELGVLITVDLRRVAAPLDVDQQRGVLDDLLLAARLVGVGINLKCCPCFVFAAVLPMTRKISRVFACDILHQNHSCPVPVR